MKAYRKVSFRCYVSVGKPGLSWCRSPAAYNQCEQEEEHGSHCNLCPKWQIAFPSSTTPLSFSFLAAFHFRPLLHDTSVLQLLWPWPAALLRNVTNKTEGNHTMQRAAEKISGAIDESAHNKHAVILQYTSLSAIVILSSSILPIPSPSNYCSSGCKLRCTSVASLLQPRALPVQQLSPCSSVRDTGIQS